MFAPIDGARHNLGSKLNRARCFEQGFESLRFAQQKGVFGDGGSTLPEDVVQLTD